MVEPAIDIALDVAVSGPSCSGVALAITQAIDVVRNIFLLCGAFTRIDRISAAVDVRASKLSAIIGNIPGGSGWSQCTEPGRKLEIADCRLGIGIADRYDLAEGRYLVVAAYIVPLYVRHTSAFRQCGIDVCRVSG